MSQARTIGPGSGAATPWSLGRPRLCRLFQAGAGLAALSYAQAFAVAPRSGGGAQIGAESLSTVPEIVVTAQKRQETANSVPMAITAATGAQLARQGINQPRDLVKLVPSFTYTDSYVGSPIYTLRGVGFSDTSLGGRPTVSIYTDEAPLPFAIETRGVNLDLERVEVLMGPQGTLFGQNATGGAINYIAAKPTQTFQAGVDAGYGSYNAWNIGGFASGPLTDTLLARIAVDHTQNDGWQKSYTTGAGNGAGDFTNGRLLLTWTPTNDLKVQANINGWIDHSQVQAAQLIAVVPEIPDFTAAVPGLATYPLSPLNDRAADFNPGQDYHRHNSFFQTNLRSDYRLSDGLTLTSIMSFSRYTEDQLLDADGTTLSSLSYLTRGRLTSASQEVRLAGDVLQRGHFVIGGSYAYDQSLQRDIAEIPQSTSAYVFTPLGLPSFPDFFDKVDQLETTVAGFASADYTITDAVKLYGGVRYTQANDKFDGCTGDTGNGVTAADFGAFQNYVRSLAGLAPNSPIAPGGCITANDQDVPGLVVDKLNQNNVSWRIGGEWTPAARTLLYANISQGYKAGGFPDLSGTITSQFRPASQESVIAYEAGFKATLLERTLQLNGALFHYDYRDKQILGFVVDPVFGPLLKLVNIPKSQITGAELQLAWAPIQGLTASLGGSYIDSEILDHFTNYNPFAAAQDFGGEAFPNTPRWKLVSGVDYQWRLTDGLDGFVGGNLTYQSATNSELGDQHLFDVKAYALLDLRAGVETKDGVWKISIWGRNVGNTYYWSSTSYIGDTVTRFTGMPATYGVALSYRYR